MDDGPDARKRHDSQANPAEDSHTHNSPDDVQNQGCKVNVIGNLSLVHSFIGFGLISIDRYFRQIGDIDLDIFLAEPPFPDDEKCAE